MYVLLLRHEVVLHGGVDLAVSKNEGLYYGRAFSNPPKRPPIERNSLNDVAASAANIVVDDPLVGGNVCRPLHDLGRKEIPSHRLLLG